ncbi:MAG TPA: helix-turn-helix domain-containing protein [Candidatus Borkfalkia avistercoris]|uniref:Helix-turn-helix domain-containing protein n=1 Tax=Candidatus Borkfalkia avistercoris TaxID=2838504 RepID=A0A9D2A6X8_9FIRM|nr:helix-turn-helix domain-containing protein [Candidatus Borkfalkia avistercoris]
MKRSLETENILHYSTANPADELDICRLGRALSVPERIKILRALQDRPHNIIEISTMLNIPLSSVSFHIGVLEEAKLIRVEYKPAPKGHMKLCSIGTIISSVHFTKVKEVEESEIIVEMPVGCYSQCNVSKAYMADEQGFIFRENASPYMLFTPERIKGQIFSFQSGYVVYSFPNLFILNNQYRRLSFSFECCSEAPYYRENWPSDITIWINDVEIATFCSPGDFGGKRGNYTPNYWELNSTQFGLLKKFTIDDSGCYIDDIFDNKNHVFDELKLDSSKQIELKIGMKEDAKHIGGINIFGKNFGNYPQNILMILSKPD